MRTTSRKQTGVAALAVVALLLFGIAITVLYLNRGLVFEQKTSANQLRSTQALETAEAGLEWAIGMLNNSLNINNACTPVTTAGATTFRRMYTQVNWPDTTIAAATTTFPGCKVSVDSATLVATLNCSCPSLGNAAADGDERPSFTVAFAPVPQTPNNPTGPMLPDAVRITATGCTPTTQACLPGTSSGGSGPDAVATVSTVVKFMPPVRAAPAAALTCGRNCSPGGNYKVINTDVSTNGVTINAGGTVEVRNSAQTATIPGVPPANAQVSGDSSLAALSGTDANCQREKVFKSYFGSTIDQYRNTPTTATIADCDQPSACGTKIQAAMQQGFRSFYFPDGVSLNNSAPFSALGSRTDPVTIVTPSDFNINGNISVYGLIFSNSANTNDLGTGTADIYGGIVVCGNQESNGNGTIAYDPAVLLNAQRNASVASKMAGSWTDACRLTRNPATPTVPPVLVCE